ncbi:MAG TPA: DUF4129 domain-containing protein [Anaerolineae bacterium]|nr:DUF4129 domain-containing protein [Anaerolineae bacterium]HQK14616.1 DUF4129 domain-containing protein [Anaerolineae bacterium]
MNQPVPQIHEADAYIETQGTAPVSNPYRHNRLPALIVGLMVGCIAFAVTELLRRIAPTWNGTYFLIIPILAAFVGHATYRITSERYGSAADRQRIRRLELAMIFLLLKIATYLDNTLPEIWDDIRHWPTNPFSFFDLETLVAFALACAAWFSAAHTARDLEAVADPEIYRGETGPMERLNRRFLWGGMLLLLISGMARIEITAMLHPDRPAISGLALNVLVYFILGMAMLGQVRRVWKSRLWEQQHYRISQLLQKAWLKYCLISLFIALLIAFVLPNRYTLGLFDIVGYIVTAIGYLAMMIYAGVATLFNLLMSLLFKSDSTVALPSLPEASPLPPDIEPSSRTPLLWLPILRSIVFWVVALGAIGYVVYSYFKDRPELGHAFTNFKIIQTARSWWRALRLWWRNLRRQVRRKLPTLALNFSFLRRKGTHRETVAVRRKREALREQMLYYYLETLDHARAEGFPRHDSQTPYEYQSALDPTLPEAQAELSALTQAFVEARYSNHPITPDDVTRQQVNAQSVHAALDKLHTSSQLTND